MRAKLRQVNDQLKVRRHQPIPEQGRWLAAVVRGHQAYYTVHGNSDAITAFRTQVAPHWHKALPAPQPARPDDLGTNEPHPDSMATSPPRDASLPGGPLRRHSPKVGARCGSPARWDLCGGPPARAVPTATPFAGAGREVADGDGQTCLSGQGGQFGLS